MNLLITALTLGSKIVSAFHGTDDVFCCHNNVIKAFPHGSIEINSYDEEKKCTGFKLLDLNLIKVIYNSDCESQTLSSIFGDQQFQRLNKRQNKVVKKTTGTFDRYYNYELLKYILREAGKLPGATFIESIGKTHEGRDIFAFKIGTENDQCSNKKAIWVNGGLHAREWLSPAAIFYTIVTLLQSQDPNIKDLLKYYDFHFTPISNPDGYVYSFTKDRKWRKNRRNNGDGTFGVDLNRNWDDHWEYNFGSVSTQTKSDGYKGVAPHSEPEVRALAKYVYNIPNRYASLDVHTFGQKILRSWGWTRDAPENDDKLKEIANVMIEAFKKSNYTYTTERGGVEHPANGCLDDWMTSSAGFTAFTVELSPQIINGGRYEDFQPDEKNIRPVSESFFNAFVAFATHLKDRI